MTETSTVTVTSTTSTLVPVQHSTIVVVTDNWSYILATIAIVVPAYLLIAFMLRRR